ncbi:MAG: L-seryl-tRNA(Sec) selenium transferase [Bryobacteraceae bacterium]|nr:MAG: L-seryl-tRNA(Sec) selenium transferase [Bryobacteraceae bacterium]
MLPGVDELARSIALPVPHALVVTEARAVLEECRRLIQRGETLAEEPLTALERRLGALLEPSLRRVINATGVILHTNLGRAPLPEFPAPQGYSNLEYDLETGRRGKRDVHAAPLLERLLGAPGIVVNNNAAAVFLALHELAAGGEVIVSRGELVEIGDGFRIPEIMARSGARLVEVGTTNRTRIEDYRHAISPDTRLLLRVHPSNFVIQGFAGRPSIEELCLLGRERGIPVYEDLGSGCLVDLTPYGVNEPLAQASLRAGASLVSFSGDKLLGGPQAGILAGKHEIVQRLRRNPMFRALRVDKMVYAALETALRLTLLEKWNDLPVLRMIRLSPDEIAERARRMAGEINASGRLRADVLRGESLLGGGSTPGQALPTCLVAVTPDAAQLERKLRAHQPPVIARIDDERLLVDLRTVAPEDDATVLAALLA